MVHYKHKKRTAKDVNIIVLHEPLTWDIETAWRALTQQCYGVHYSIDRGAILSSGFGDKEAVDGRVKYHMIPSINICDHAGHLNDTSIGIEIASAFSTYKGPNGKWVPPEERPYPVQTVPQWNPPRPWIPKKGNLPADPKPPFARPHRKDHVLPSEVQVKSLYNLCLHLVKQYNFPVPEPRASQYQVNSLAVLESIFPGIAVCHAEYKGFYWRGFSKSLNKEITGRRGKYAHLFKGPTAGGIVAHAHAGSTHADALFFEHYLFMRFSGVPHDGAWKSTVAACHYAVGQYPPGHPSAGEIIPRNYNRDGTPTQQKDYTTNFHLNLSGDPSIFWENPDVQISAELGPGPEIFNYLAPKFSEYSQSTGAGLVENHLIQVNLL